MVLDQISGQSDLCHAVVVCSSGYGDSGDLLRSIRRQRQMCIGASCSTVRTPYRVFLTR